MERVEETPPLSEGLLSCGLLVDPKSLYFECLLDVSLSELKEQIIFFKVSSIKVTVTVTIWKCL